MCVCVREREEATRGEGENAGGKKGERSPGRSAEGCDEMVVYLCRHLCSPSSSSSLRQTVQADRRPPLRLRPRGFIGSEAVATRRGRSGPRQRCINRAADLA